VTFLLDTNVVSEIRKKSPNEGVAEWFASTQSHELFLSVLVIGEIRQGVDRLARRDPRQASVIDQWLRQLMDAYGDRVVPVTAEIAETWGRLNVPNRLPVVDCLLAATALVHDWTLVTRNASDVATTGARILDPFTS